MSAEALARWQEEQRRQIEADVLNELASHEVVGYIQKVRWRERGPRVGRGRGRGPRLAPRAAVARLPVCSLCPTAARGSLACLLLLLTRMRAGGALATRHATLAPADPTRRCPLLQIEDERDRYRAAQRTETQRVNEMRIALAAQKRLLESKEAVALVRSESSGAPASARGAPPPLRTTLSVASGRIS